jgi:hypothetical protein
MSREDLIDVICYLNEGISREYLETLTDDRLQAYYTHLRALRLMRLMDRSRL